MTMEKFESTFEDKDFKKIGYSVPSAENKELIEKYFGENGYALLKNLMWDIEGYLKIIKKDCAEREEDVENPLGRI